MVDKMLYHTVFAHFFAQRSILQDIVDILGIFVAKSFFHALICSFIRSNNVFLVFLGPYEWLWFNPTRHNTFFHLVYFV
jgi:hypothetical protein